MSAAVATCRGEGSCPILLDEITDAEVDKSVREVPELWRELLAGLPAEATAVVASPSATSSAALEHLDDDGSRRPALHVATHLLSAAGRALAAAGYLRPQAGEVAGLFAGVGLPKPAVEVVEVGRRGLVGDVQRDRKHHGRPLQALCVWSGDVVDALAAEGHPIAPGAAGENVSVRGIEWADVRPGMILRLGDVVAELSAWSTPCAKNRRWFLPNPDGGHPEGRMDADRHPGWSRIYAYVLEGGTVRVGDPVTLT